MTAQHSNFEVISAASPVRPGEAIIIYALGMGQTEAARLRPQIPWQRL